MSKVIVFGSLNMDLSIESDHMPQLGETIMGRGFITNPGGKGANQAVAAARLGAEVVMLGAVGDDAFGDQMIAALAEQGVRCDRIGRVKDAPTGVALITRVSGDNFITIDSGANLSGDLDYVTDALDSEARGGDVFLCQLECDYETTMRAVVRAHERGMYTVVNPAPARELCDWVYEHIDLVVVNENECETLTGIYPDTKEHALAAIEALEERGVGAVAVTIGARGSIVHANGQVLVSVPPKVEAIDTTCAGDTYIGALVAGYSHGLPIDEALAIATEASALATTRIGAQQSIPLISEVKTSRA
jgi:ribokinase